MFLKLNIKLGPNFFFIFYSKNLVELVSHKFHLRSTFFFTNIINLTKDTDLLQNKLSHQAHDFAVKMTNQSIYPRFVTKK